MVCWSTLFFDWRGTAEAGPASLRGSLPAGRAKRQRAVGTHASVSSRPRQAPSRRRSHAARRKCLAGAVQVFHIRRCSPIVVMGRDFTCLHQAFIRRSDPGRHGGKHPECTHAAGTRFVQALASRCSDGFSSKNRSGLASCRQAYQRRLS